LLYGWLSRTVEEVFGVREAYLIASASSYVVPGLIAIGAIFVSYRLGIWQIDIPTLNISRVFIGVDPVTLRLPILVVDLSLANPGPPSTFRDWKLQIQPIFGKRVTISISINFGDDYGDLSTKPLETGGQRFATYAAFHPSFDFPAMRKASSTFIVKARDVRGRQISARYILENDIELPFP
jgi:hypothetical protein